MRAALIAAALAAAAGVRAGPPAGAAAPVPLALAERQVVTLEFDRRIARVSVTDPELLSVKTRGARAEVGALRGGRGALELAFDDGATVVYDVSVSGVRRAAAAGEGAPATISVGVGEERRVPAPGVARVLVEENGAVRVRIDGQSVVIVGVSTGTTSMVLVDAAGARTTWAVSVR